MTTFIKRVLLNRIIINQQIFSAAIYESLKHCKSMPYMWLKTSGGREVASSSLVTPTKSKEPQNQSLRFAALSYYSHILRLISFKKH